jgi:hypothetical protein
MRFRFTIRDLLWLTAMIALAVGWWLDHRKITQENERLKNPQQTIHFDFYSQTTLPPATF